MFLFVWFFVPETKGRSLESMDELFGVTESSKTDLEGRKETFDSKSDGRATQVEVR